MTTFNAADHPRAGDGQFTEKLQADPGTDILGAGGTVADVTARQQAALDRSILVDQELVDVGVQGAVRRIMDEFDGITQIEVRDDEGNSNFQFTVFVNGEDVELPGELEDDLWDMTCQIDPGRAILWSKWCAGYDPDSERQPFGLVIDKHTGSLDQAIINLNLFRS